MLRLLPLSLLIACSAEPENTVSDELDFCERPSVSDGSVGRSFLLSHCTACHSSENAGKERNGAPEELNYNSHAAFMENLARVQANCAVETTHPCNDVTPREVEDFLGWIECGAPSSLTELPTFEVAESGESFEALTYVREFPEGIEVTRQIEVGSRGFFPPSPWSRTLFERYGEEVWLYSETLYREDGSVLVSIDFGTGLLIRRPDAAVLTDTLEVEIQENGAWTTEVVDFEVTLGQGEELDGREATHSPEEIHVQGSLGMEWTWHYMPDGAPSAKAHSLDGERSWTALSILSPQGPALGPLGLNDGVQWIERIHVPGGWSQ